MSTPTTTPSTSSTRKPASSRGAATGNTTAPRARRGGQRGGLRPFVELYGNLSRDPSEATLRNTASDLKEAPQRSLQLFGEHIERRLAAGDSIPQIVDDTKGQIRIYLLPGERRQLVDQRLFGGRKKTRKGKSRHRYTRRR